MSITICIWWKKIQILNIYKGDTLELEDKLTSFFSWIILTNKICLLKDRLYPSEEKKSKYWKSAKLHHRLVWVSSGWPISKLRVSTFSLFGEIKARTDHIQKTTWSSRGAMNYTVSCNQYCDLQNMWRVEGMYATTQQQINMSRVDTYSCNHFVNMVSKPVMFMHGSYSNLLEKEFGNLMRCEPSTPCAKCGLAHHNE